MLTSTLTYFAFILGVAVVIVGGLLVILVLFIGAAILTGAIVRLLSKEE